MEFEYDREEAKAYKRLYLANKKLTKARKALDEANKKFQEANAEQEQAWKTWREISNKIKPKNDEIF